MPNDALLLAAAEVVLNNWELAPLLAIPSFVALGVLDGIFNSDTESDTEGTDADDLFDETPDDTEDDLNDDLFDGEGFDDQEFEEGAGESELEARVDQLEEELSSLSSTVSTVRTENEQISESVDEIEENVRKLLDIYKMVTKGVNPFVDEQGGSISAEIDDESLGIFGDDDTDAETEELDEDVMEAEAEEFFADDFEESDFDDGDGVDDSDIESDDSNPPEDDVEFEALDESADPMDSNESDDAQSFDDLKEEYESDDPEFEELDETDESDLHSEPTDDHQLTESTSSDGEAMMELDSEMDTSDQPSSMAASPSDQIENQSTQKSTIKAEKPYLDELPAGYTEDLIVLEWIEFLIEESSPAAAQNALTYYERIRWIGPRAADQLRSFLDGHPDVDGSIDANTAPETLSTDHHSRSLQYIARLDGTILDSWSERSRKRWLHR